MTQLDWTQLLPDMLSQLAQGNRLTIHATGGSMRPFLREERDKVCLAALPQGAPQPGMIYFYRRAGGGYAIHRLWRTEPDGTLTMLGDAQYTAEYGITPAQLLAYVPEILRDGTTTVRCDTPAARKKAVRQMNERMLHPARAKKSAALRARWHRRLQHPLAALRRRLHKD